MRWVSIYISRPRKNDWLDLFNKANAVEQLRFYRTVSSHLESISPIHLNNIPNLGTARTGILVQEDHYLTLPATERAVPREIHQNNGEIRYNVDQLANPDSFYFWPGGIWKNDCFLLGEMASVHNVGFTVAIVKKIRYVMSKTFDFQGAYWIGPECQRLYSHFNITTDYRYPI